MNNEERAHLTAEISRYVAGPLMPDAVNTAYERLTFNNREVTSVLQWDLLEEMVFNEDTFRTEVKLVWRKVR